MGHLRESIALYWKRTCLKHTTAKARSILGIVRRSLKSCTQQVKERAYHALVRPRLEYAACSWNPHTDKDVKAVEQVQREAARFVTGQYERRASVSQMVQDLGWNSFEDRRQLAACSLFYKIHHNLVNISFPEGMRPGPRGHQHSFLQPHTNTLTLRYSFFIRTIPVWNLLSPTVIQVPTKYQVPSNCKLSQ